MHRFSLFFLLLALSGCVSAPARVRHATDTYAAVLPGVTLTVNVYEQGIPKPDSQRFAGHSVKGRALLAFLQKPGRPWRRSITTYVPAFEIHDSRALNLNLAGTMAVLNIRDCGQYTADITQEECTALMKQIWTP